MSDRPRGEKIKSKKIIEPEDDEEDTNDGEDLKRDEKSGGGFVEDDDDDDDEEDDEDEAAAAAEFNDFIDQGQDEPDEGDEAGGKSDASSSNEEATDVDDDDLELLKDNLNVDNLEEIGIKRQKRKRIIVQSESEEESEEPHEKKKVSDRPKQSSREKKRESSGKSRRRPSDEDDLGDQEPEDGEDLEDINDDDDREIDEAEEDNRQSDEGSFIVDDSDDEAEGINKDRARALKKKKQRNQYTDEAQQEAMDIFGVDAGELVAQIDENDQDNENEYEEDDDDEYYSGDEEMLDEEGGVSSRRKTKRQQKAATHTKLEDIFEPAELEKNLMTEKDQLIRMEDKPERFMTRGVPVTSEPDESELEREAEWIHTHAFCINSTISFQEQPPFKDSRVIVKIKDVLNFIRNEFLEVPFIANYRKEYIQPDLTVDDLWKVYEMDEKYCQLKARKENFQKLYERMQRYQAAQVEQWKQKRAELEESGTEESMEDLAAINRALDMIRPIEQSDIDRVRGVQTIEEFFDCYQHFQLYYSVDLIPMKEYEFDQRQANKGQTKKKKIVKKIIRRPREITEDMEEGENPEDEEIEIEEEVEVDIDEDDDDYQQEEVRLTKYALPKKDRYHQYKLAGLLELSRKFGLTPEQYGENLHADYQKNEVEQCGVEPRLLANDYCRQPYFSEPEQVLAAVRYMVAVELAREPSVRSSVRDHYYKNVAISVRPTVPRGYSTIDEDHPCYPLKYLRKKPCKDLTEDQYLKLHLAEQDELLKIEFQVLELDTITASKSNEKLNGSIGGGTVGGDDDWDDPVSSSKPLPSKSQPTPATASMFRTVDEKLKSFYQKDEFSYNVEQWNMQRSMIIDEMLQSHLYPEFEREVRAKLLREAKAFVFKQSATRLRNIIRVAPYAPATLDEEDEGLRVLVFVYAASAADRNLESNDDLQLGVCACVNSDGELDDFLWLKHLLSRGRFGQNDNDNHHQNSFVAQQRRDKIKEMQKIEEFMIEKRPKLIVVSGESREAMNIVDDLNELLRQMRENGGDQVGSLGNVHVEIVDPEVGKLVESSKSCQVNFPQTVANNSAVKQAISLARAVQDPLLCYSQLVNMERDVLSLKLHPLMPLLVTSRESEDASELFRLLEIEFINCANDVGVDLNRCNQQPHTSNVLQFVSGFGMRKAQHLLKLLRQERLALKGKLPSDKQFKTYPVAKNRVSMVSKYQLGARLFINSAGFIKFDVDYIKREIDEEEDEDEDDEERRERRRRGQSSQGDEDDDFTEPLDSTRIHPESYEWAEKMCVDALDVEEDDDEEGHRRANSTINAKKAVKEIMENPKRLKDLDLDAFAEELMRTGHGNKITTLNEIRQELNYRYRDKRTPFRSLDTNEKFYLLLKETEQTFRVGKMVACKCINIARRKPNKEQLDEANPIKDDNTFMWQCSFCKRNDFSDLSKVWTHFDTGECPGPAVGVRTVLENNCPGFVSLKFLSDQHVTNPDERVKVGQVFNARIKSIDTEKGRVDLTSRSSDLRDDSGEWRPRKDRYYDYGAQQQDDEKINEKKRKEEHKSTYTKRVIAHPQFKNVDYNKVVQMLKEMNVGDCIFRPSSKGPDHLTVTWKIWNDCYGNVDILEEKKVNAFSLGKRLIIDGEDYEDLDEIIARYISPMASNVKEILSHKNFCDLRQLDPNYTPNVKPSNDPSSMKPSQQEIDLVEKHFREEKMKNPSRIPYAMVCCNNWPGRFFLYYMIKSTKPPRWEYIKVINDGFTFRGRKFSSFNDLITWFKTHYNEPFSNISNTKPPENSQSLSSSLPASSGSGDLSNQMNQMSFMPNNGGASYNNNNNDNWDDVPMTSGANSGNGMQSTFDRLLGDDRRQSNDQQNWNNRRFDNQSQGWRGRGGGGNRDGGSRGDGPRPSRFSNNYNDNWDNQDSRPSRGGRGGGGRPSRGRGGYFNNGNSSYRAPGGYNNNNGNNDDWDDNNKMDSGSSQKTSRFDDNWRPQNTNDGFGQSYNQAGSGGGQYNSNNTSATPAPVSNRNPVDDENWD